MTDDVLDALPLSYTGIALCGKFLVDPLKILVRWGTTVFSLVFHSGTHGIRTRDMWVVGHIVCQLSHVHIRCELLETSFSEMHIVICRFLDDPFLDDPLLISLQWIMHSHGHYPPRIWFWVWWKGRNLLTWLNWNSFRAWTSTIEIGCVAVEGIDVERQLCRRRRRVARINFGVQRHFMI